MPKIFISYRRSDAREEAARIATRAAADFGESSVFFDTDTLRAGDAFPAEIEANIRSSDALLVVIGPDWLAQDDETGATRIRNAHDWVRHEIHLALSLGVTIYPVLVRGATMPTASDLPGDIRALTEKNAVTLDSGEFAGDLRALIDRIRGGSPLYAALSVLVAGLVGGLLWFTIDETMSFIRFAYEAIWTLAAEFHDPSGTEFTRGPDGYFYCDKPERPETVDDSYKRAHYAFIACQSAVVLDKSVGSLLFLNLVHIVNYGMYFAVLSVGALIAARSYMTVGADRILPAVVSGLACFVSTGVLIFSLDSTELARDSMAQSGGLLFPACVAAFAIGMVLPIRRALRMSTWDAFIGGGLMFFSLLLTEWLYFGIELTPDTPFLPPWLAAAAAAEYDGEYGGFFFSWLIIDFGCLHQDGAGAVCELAGLMSSQVVCFSIVLIGACLVPRWRYSLWRVLGLCVFLAIVVLVVVHILSLLEGLLGGTRIIADMLIPRAFVYAAAAWLLARRRIRHRREEVSVTLPV